MKKRIYRGTPIGKVNVEKLEQVLSGDRVVFGVDIGKEVMAGAFVTEDRRAVQNIVWRSPEQTMEVVRMLRSLPARVEVVIEPSGTYGDPFRHQCLEAGCDVFRVSTKRSHDAAEVFDGVPSWHDVKSAHVISRLHLEGASHRWRVRDVGERELTAAMRVLTMHDRFVHSNLNRIEAQLGRHWPELTCHLRLVGGTILRLLEASGGPEWVREDRDRAARMIREWGGSFLKQETIDGAVASAQTIGVPMIEAECQALRQMAQQTLESRKKARQARARVELLVSRHKQGRALQGVVGTMAAGAMLANGMNPIVFDSSRSLLKGMGLNLRERSSGKHKGQLKITKRGPGEVRFYLYLAVLRLINTHPHLDRWYSRKVKRDGGVKNKAIIALMRDVSTALWHVARGSAFDPAKLVSEE